MGLVIGHIFVDAREAVDACCCMHRSYAHHSNRPWQASNQVSNMVGQLEVTTSVHVAATACR